LVAKKWLVLEDFVKLPRFIPRSIAFRIRWPKRKDGTNGLTYCFRWKIRNEIT